MYVNVVFVFISQLNSHLKQKYLLLLLLLLSLLFTAFAVVYILRMDSRPDLTAIIDWAKNKQTTKFLPSLHIQIGLLECQSVSIRNKTTELYKSLI